jgi:glutamate dehydrogenase (NADP+)
VFLLLFPSLFLPPVGDIGVGGREVGYLQGQYKKLTNSFVGVLTGKGRNWGGSLIRPEATGYGAVYFANEMLTDNGDKLSGKRCVVSGAGNVAQYTIEKLLDFGAIPLTASDSDGYILEEGSYKLSYGAEVVVCPLLS